MNRKTISLLLAAIIAACGQTQDVSEDATAADTTPTEAVDEAPADVDYSDTANWLCHPGKAGDACETDLSTTIVAEDGSTVIEAFQAAEAPSVDCFYVYPTVSEDTSPNSDMVANAEEMRVIEQQFARFGSICRLYAPLYRQVTLPHLRSYLVTGEYGAHPTLNYDDVKNAWDTYLADENNGRGVVLLGHSQGAGLIARLTVEEIAGSDVEDRMISVMPIGTNVYPDEAGQYPLPPCESGSDNACLVAYVSFRGDREPPADSRFGKTEADDKRALCVNPADLAGDDNVLRAYLARRAFAAGVEGSFGEGVEVSTPFAAVPGLLSAECRSNDTHTWLAIDINADPEDARADDITGDVVVAGAVLEDWGLHLIDMNVAMGNLIALADAQSEAWLQKQSDTAESAGSE